MSKVDNINSFRQKQFFEKGLTSRAISEMLLERSKQAALSLGVELLEEEVQILCGNAHQRKHGELYHRGGSEKSVMVVDGGKYPFRRPRVHNEDGEVELETLKRLKDQDLYDETIAGRMMLGATTRNYAPLIDSYSKKLSVSKSTVSRAFVRASQKDLDDINQGDLSQYRFVGIVIDGIEVAGRTIVGAMGVTETLHKIPLGIREGSTENADLVKDLLSAIMERKFTLRCPKLFAVIDGSKALRKGLIDVFGDKILIQRCWLHKLRNLTSYAPDKYHKQIHWRMKKLMNLVKFDEAMKELASFTEWLSEISQEAESSMNEVGEELLTVHRLGLSKALRSSLSTTNSIESLYSIVRTKTNRVKNWKSSSKKNQITRWIASAIKSHQKKMRRLRGCNDAPNLIVALGGELEIQERTA